VEPICRKQLADWGIDYFDLYIVHFPVALKHVPVEVRYPPGWTYSEEDGDVQLSNATIQETWTAMESLVHKGLAKSIGVSNFQGSLILDLLRYAKIRPATLQIEHHPYLVQPTLLQLAKSEGIAVTAYSSFGPQSFIELEWQKAKDTPVLFEHPVVVAIAEKHKKTPAQVLLRWATQRGLAVIPKSNNPERLHANLDVTSFDLSESELESISGLDRHLRFNNPTDVSPYPLLPFFILKLPWLAVGRGWLTRTVSRHPAHLRIDVSSRLISSHLISSQDSGGYLGVGMISRLPLPSIGGFLSYRIYVEGWLQRAVRLSISHRSHVKSLPSSKSAVKFGSRSNAQFAANSCDECCLAARLE
jgi:diketogulonate reductase-like aldo/keto reductase